MKALKLLPKVGQVFAPALAKMQGISLSDDISSIAPALAELFDRLNAGDSQALTRELLQNTKVTVDGKFVSLNSDATIDAVFQGRLGALFGAIKLSLEVNFKDFILGALAAAQSRAPVGASEST
jgi:hypothetical protein